ncbi:MAG: metallophosphoesterase family protein [Parvibaculaceae bacterium]
MSLLTFAIGDIHGCQRALTDLLRQCRDHARGQPHRLVFIGDYVDRGLDSRAVIATLRALEQQQEKPDMVVCLMGNHEEMMLGAIDTGDAMNWLFNGGGETLQSYGVRNPMVVPEEDVAWLRGLRLSFDDGQRFFAHAGVDPDQPLDRQEREALLWIRGPFHRATKDYGRLIVHGHTPSRNGRPEIRPNRINIDTACVYGGTLTAAVFTEDSIAPVKFLTARED